MALLGLVYSFLSRSGVVWSYLASWKKDLTLPKLTTAARLCHPRKIIFYNQLFMWYIGSTLQDSSHYQIDYICDRKSLQTFICHCWVGGGSKWCIGSRKGHPPLPRPPSSSCCSRDVEASPLLTSAPCKQKHGGHKWKKHMSSSAKSS